MKHAIRLTRKQKIFVKSKHLIPEHWLRVMDTSEELTIVNKKSGKIKTFEKGGEH